MIDYHTKFLQLYIAERHLLRQRWAHTDGHKTIIKEVNIQYFRKILKNQQSWTKRRQY